MNVLAICQGPAYGDEHSYNGLRLAGALAKHDQLTAPAHRATLDDLADWVLWADKIVTF